MAQNRLLWTGRSDRGAINAPPSGRLLESDVDDFNERRRQIADYGAYMDDPDGDAQQRAVERAADNEEVNGVHGSNVTV